MSQRVITRPSRDFTTEFLFEAKAALGAPWDTNEPATAAIRQVRVWTLLGPRWVDREQIYMTWRSVDVAAVAHAGNKVRDSRFRFRCWLATTPTGDETSLRSRFTGPREFRYCRDFDRNIWIYWTPEHRSWTIAHVDRNGHHMRLAGTFEMALRVAAEIITA